jgi:hypothetical protein
VGGAVAVAFWGLEEGGCGIDFIFGGRFVLDPRGYLSAKWREAGRN